MLAALPDRRFDIVVDALFGIGLARPLQGEFLDGARWINEHAERVVALDVPSGLDSDRGAWVGDVEGVRADLTVTFLGDKPGLHTGAGIDAAGEVQVDRLGLEAGPSAVSLTAPDDFPDIARPRRRDTHKGSFGNVLVVGGGAGMVGAPLLAARAALRLGAGRVYVDCIGAPELRVDPVQPELMFRPHASITDPECAVVGCGLGVDGAARVGVRVVARASARPRDRCRRTQSPRGGAGAASGAARANGPVGADAASARSRATAGDLRARRPAGPAGRRANARRRLARDRRAQGRRHRRSRHRTAEPPSIRPALPALATAGTGDVLAGMLGALLAQGFDAWQSVVAAVWLHGAAVRGAGDIGIVAGDLAPRAAEALRGLREGG